MARFRGSARVRGHRDRTLQRARASRWSYRRGAADVGERLVTERGRAPRSQVTQCVQPPGNARWTERSPSRCPRGDPRGLPTRTTDALPCAWPGRSDIPGVAGWPPILAVVPIVGIQEATPARSRSRAADQNLIRSSRLARSHSPAISCSSAKAAARYSTSMSCRMRAPAA